MSRPHQRIEISTLGIPPVKHPGSNEKKKNTLRHNNLQKKAHTEARDSDWPVEWLHRKMKLTIIYYRGEGKPDSANIIGGIADALEAIWYHNDRQLVEINYSELEKSRKKYRDRYQVAIEALAK